MFVCDYGFRGGAVSWFRWYATLSVISMSQWNYVPSLCHCCRSISLCSVFTAIFADKTKFSVYLYSVYVAV